MSEFRSGNGSVWLDLITTLAGRYREVQVDAIGTPERLHAWLTSVGLEPAGEVTEADRELAATTREALHRVTSATIDGARPDDADVATLQQALAYDVTPGLEASPRGLAVGPPATAAQAIGHITRAAITALTSDDVAYLKHCGDDTCASIFLDRTGRRRWCSDLSCGNRMRVRAHRARANPT